MLDGLCHWGDKKLSVGKLHGSFAPAMANRIPENDLTGCPSRYRLQLLTGLSSSGRRKAVPVSLPFGAW
jgi:hypothetical protein